MQNELSTVVCFSTFLAVHPDSKTGTVHLLQTARSLPVPRMPQEGSVLSVNVRRPSAAIYTIHLQVWRLRKTVSIILVSDQINIHSLENYIIHYNVESVIIHHPKSSISHWQWYQSLCNTLLKGVPGESHQIWVLVLWCQRLLYLLVSTYLSKA